MSTMIESAVDTVRERGERLARELPYSIDWPDGLVDRATDELVHGFDALKVVVVPAATMAVSAGTTAAISGSRSARRHPALMVGGAVAVVAVVAVVIWLVRRRRTSSDQEQLSDAATESARPVSAA